MLGLGCRFHKILGSGLLLVVAVATFGRQANPGEVKLGLLGDLSSDTSYMKAAKLAIDDRVNEINAAGGIKGRKVTLITSDTKGDSDLVVPSAKHLINQDGVCGIIGPEFSQGAFNLGSIAEAAKVPIVAITASNPRVTQNDNGSVKPYMFRACFIDPYEATILADFAFQDLNKRKAAFIFCSDYDYPKVIMKHFEGEFTRLGGQVVGRESFRNQSTNYKNQLTNLAKANPDCMIIATAEYLDVVGIATQAELLGLKFQYLGVDGWVANELPSKAGKQLEGCYVTNGLSTDEPRFADFNARFQKAHNLACNVTAYYALDALMAMEYAAGVSLKQAGKIDSSVMKQALETMKDVPVFSSRMTMEPDTHNPHQVPMLILTIKHSQWRTFKTYKPE
ncbi:MAG: ABC transporter substrate-binding protein [Holophaga sp.]|jgi:branched-chain amino acid transport system substrate-binding protein